jgi:hypothetical protein
VSTQTIWRACTSKLTVNLLVADAPLQDSRDLPISTQEFYSSRGKKGETMHNIDRDRHAVAKGIPLLAITLIGFALAITFFL